MQRSGSKGFANDDVGYSHFVKVVTLGVVTGFEVEADCRVPCVGVELAGAAVLRKGLAEVEHGRSNAAVLPHRRDGDALHSDGVVLGHQEASGAELAADKAGHVDEVALGLDLLRGRHHSHRVAQHLITELHGFAIAPAFMLDDLESKQPNHRPCLDRFQVLVVAHSMETTNRLSRMVGKIEQVAGPFRSAAITLALSRVVKFVGTAGLQVEELTPERAVVSVKNRKKVQNHIGSIHACAMALLAETATGFVVGMNLPDAAVPVIKTIKIDYVKRATGAMRAVATLTNEQRHRITTTPKGEVLVKCVVTDEKGTEPIDCEMTWAWTPKRPSN